MKIAVIGTGNVGGALATGWSKKGHQILLGVKSKAAFKGKHLLENDRTTLHTVKEACTEAEVIVVATPPQAAEEIASEIAPAGGKVIIDATNAVRSGPDGYETAYHLFEAQTEAELVKCFNTTGFENMADPVYGPIRLDMFMAGDSAQAKKVAAQLSADLGFEHCYDFGPADKVVLLEKFALSWINLAIFQGMGRNIGLKLIRRP